MTNITGTQLISEVESLAKGADNRYVLGGTGPNDYDCSGLIYAALGKLGYKNVPRTSEEQWAWVKQNHAEVSKAQLQPGDLVFANFGNEDSPGHVGIYIGNGKVYSAQDPALGIGTATLASWGNNIVGYGRVPNETTTGDATLDSATTTGGLLGFPSEITSFFGDAKTGLDSLMWLVNPASWLRIGSFCVAVILLVLAIYVFVGAGSDQSLTPKVPNIKAVPV